MEKLNTLVCKLKEQNLLPTDILQIKKLTGDASTRNYYRIICEQNKSYIICQDQLPHPNLSNSDFVIIQKFLFFNQIPVPQIYFIDSNYNSDLDFILLEDLGDLSLIKYLANTSTLSEEYDVYKDCIDHLIKLQNLDVSNLEIVKNRFFDKEKYFYEISFTNINFLKNFLNFNITDFDQKTIFLNFEIILSKLLNQKMIFTHRDFHSRNIMMKNSKPVFIDFQDARMGPPYYDLVSFLEDCYYQLSESNKDALLRYYFNNTATELLLTKNFDEFIYLYEMMTIERLYKAIGSFAYIYFNKQNPKYLMHIGRAMERIKQILSKHSEYKTLNKLLFNYFYEN